MKYIPEVDKQALQESLSQKFVCFLFCRVQNMSMRSWMWVCWDYLYKFIFIQRLCLFHKTGFSQCDLCSDWSKIKNVWISSHDCTKLDTHRQTEHLLQFIFLFDFSPTMNQQMWRLCWSYIVSSSQNVHLTGCSVLLHTSFVQRIWDMITTWLWHNTDF